MQFFYHILKLLPERCHDGSMRSTSCASLLEGRDGLLEGDGLLKMVDEWITSIQPQGLMKMRLMHHQEHHQGYQAPQNNP